MRFPGDLCMLNRRTLLAQGGGLLATAATVGALPAWARSGGMGVPPSYPTIQGDRLDLTIGETVLPVAGRRATAITVNGMLPAPLLRFQEGRTVTIAVSNALPGGASIHWHGILLPFHMDGVPGVSFPGIRAGETFVYRYLVRQSGTFWYHSHSGLQEQLGLYGPMIIDPAEPDPVAYDREHVIVLSDWSYLSPETMLRKLKQEGGYGEKH